MKRRAVFIRWRDANDPGNWTSAPRNPEALITTVGIMFAKTKQYVSLCQSFDDNDEPLLRGVFNIPRANIIEMYELDRK